MCAIADSLGHQEDHALVYMCSTREPFSQTNVGPIVLRRAQAFSNQDCLFRVMNSHEHRKLGLKQQRSNISHCLLGVMQPGNSFQGNCYHLAKQHESYGTSDVNECDANDGRGPCDDQCENLLGEYKCACSVPGYNIKPGDPHTCVGG